jgi:NADH dehydrogenase
VGRVVVLGGGFGGAYCAQSLIRRLRGSPTHVLLLDRNNYFVFHPLLIEAGTGSLEPRHAVVSIRSFLKGGHFRMGEVEGLDPARREILFHPAGRADRERISYDHTVIALGSVTRLPEVPGLREFGCGIKNLADAVALRDRAIQMLEMADAAGDGEARRSLLHFVVVGANYTGVEVAGELQVFLRRAVRLYPGISREECRVTLVEISRRILSALDPALAEYAARRLRGRGIGIHLETSVAKVAEDRVTLSTGETLPARTLIWCAGIQPNPLITRLPLPADSRGYLLCEPDLRVRGFENLWAVGDCAVIPDEEGRPYPATAQHAVREGLHVAENLARVLRRRPTVPFRYDSFGSLAALGCRTAVARVFGIRLSGFPAYFLWRTVYWLKMPGVARKFRVAFDWTADLLFARDVVQLGVHSAPGNPQD